MAAARSGGVQPLATVRESTARVLLAARHVQIDRQALGVLARELLPRLGSGADGAGGGGDGVAWDAEGWHYNADAAADGPLTAQYVLVLDALNWCFWPSEQGTCAFMGYAKLCLVFSHPSTKMIRRMSGLEYEHLARGIKKALEQDPSALDAERLATITPEVVATWLDPSSLKFPQLAERTRKIQEVGRVLLACFDGRAANLVRAAGGSAERLVALLSALFPGFRDEAVYRGEQVYHRCEIVKASIEWGSNKTVERNSSFAIRHSLTGILLQARPDLYCRRVGGLRPARLR